MLPRVLFCQKTENNHNQKVVNSCYTIKNVRSIQKSHLSKDIRRQVEKVENYKKYNLIRTSRLFYLVNYLHITCYLYLLPSRVIIVKNSYQLRITNCPSYINCFLVFPISQISINTLHQHSLYYILVISTNSQHQRSLSLVVCRIFINISLR